MSGSQAKKARRHLRRAQADVLATFCHCPAWPDAHVETYLCHEPLPWWRRLFGGRS